VSGTATAADWEACQKARLELMSAFASAPYRPTGLATADQGLASVVQLLEWCTTLIAGATGGHLSLDRAPSCDRELFAAAAAVLRQTGDPLADVSGVQHGFWVVLGIGTSTPVLWTALAIAVAVAEYAPGTLPFAVGQAAFSIVVVVLFNLLQLVGWTVGLLRVQDVAMGCAVSLVVGLLFWPRGASSVVGDDLADAFRRGAAYLTQAVDWALGTRSDPPDTAAAAVTAGMRLDEALRGSLAQAHLLHAGRSAGTGARQTPPSGHGPRARRAGAFHGGPRGLLRASRGPRGPTRSL
jgi:hypothetical protein